MSIARLLDVRHGDGIIGAPQLNQEHYVNWVRFLRHCETNGLCTIIASYFGTTGTGEDYHDGANPADDRAFIVAEFDAGAQTFNVLVQWADAETLPGSGVAGGPALLFNSTTLDGVGVQLAWREDGTRPWAGTTNDDGSDTKGATPNTGPVWTPGTSTVHVLPRSNNTGGSHNTNKENMCRAGQDDTAGFSRAHWVANEDGIFQLYSVGDAGSYVGLYMGRYTPRTGLGLLLQEPYCMIFRDLVSFWPTGSSNIYGGTAGNSTQNGGIVGLPADGVVDLALSASPTAQSETIYQPNNLISPAQYEGESITVFQRETNIGLAGYLPTELLASFIGPNNHNTNAAADRAYMADSVAANRKWGISWDGGAVPGSNNTRTGRLSFTP